MEQTLSQHIAKLEKTIVNLKADLRKAAPSSYQRTELDLALLNAEQALNLFRQAYETEKRIPDTSRDLPSNPVG